jgi:hypothetical protein
MRLTVMRNLSADLASQVTSRAERLGEVPHPDGEGACRALRTQRRPGDARRLLRM